MYSFEYYRLCSFIDLYICLAFLPAVDLLFNAKLRYSKLFNRRTFSTRVHILQHIQRHEFCIELFKVYTYFGNFVGLKVDYLQNRAPEVDVLNFADVLLMEGDFFQGENFSLSA